MVVLALCLNGGMRAADNRLAHLRRLVEEIEGKEAGTERQRRRAAYRAIADATGLQEEYVYQLFTQKKKKMGDEAAAKIERAFANGRPPGWMDMPPAPTGDEEAEFEPIRPPTVQEAVDKLAELLLGLNEDGRAMASTALSNLARNPERAAKAAETLAMLMSIHPREPDPTQPVERAGAAAARARGKTKLTVKAGGGQKMQLDLPLRTVANPFDKSAAPPNEREWYERVKAAPKARGKT